MRRSGGRPKRHDAVNIPDPSPPDPPDPPVRLQDLYSTASVAFVNSGDDLPFVFRGINSRTNALADNWPQSRWDKFGTLAGAGKNDPQTLYGTTHPFRVVRMALNWQDCETARGVFSATFLAQLDTQIARVTAAGIKVILDPIHIKNTTTGFPAWVPFTSGATWHDTVTALTADPSPDGNYALAYLKMICARYAANRDVIAVDLINEPIYGLGGFVNNKALMVMFAELVTALRADPATTLDKILVITPCTGSTVLASTTLGLPSNTGGADYTNKLIDWAVDFPAALRTNVVMTYHWYYGGGGTGAGVGPTGNNGWSTSGFRDGNSLSGNGAAPDYNLAPTHLQTHYDRLAAQALDAGLPLFVGEYSISGQCPNKLAFCADLTAILNADGISRTFWDAYSADMSGTGTPGAFGLNLLKSPSPGSWDAGTGPGYDSRLKRVLA